MEALLISFSYIAAVIGAGFASGQEIVSFFVKYGKMSIVGIGISSFIFALFQYRIMSVCIEHGLRSYNEYLERVMSRRGGNAVRAFSWIFSVITFCAMASACAAMAREMYGINGFFGAAAVCAVSAGFMIFGGNGALRLNGVAGGIIAIGIISCCLYMLGYRERQAFSGLNMAASAASYAGYNLINAGAILCMLSCRFKSKGEALLSSCVTGMVMAVIMTLMWAILGIYYGKINLGELPMLTMAARENNLIYFDYMALLGMSVISTAVASMAGAADIYGGGGTVLLMLAAALVSGLGSFEFFINTIYRYCGYVGMLMSAYFILKKANNKDKGRILK